MLRPRPSPARPRAPDDVHLGADWLERWLPILDAPALRAYLVIAHAAPTQTYHDREALFAAMRCEDADEAERILGELEERGLLEVVRRRGQLHLHLRCRGADGLHRAGSARPSVRDAIAFHKAMMEELIAVASEDDTPALRTRIFQRYPELRESYDQSVDLAEGPGGAGRERFRLWLELSLYLRNRFDERFGGLRADHAEVFKEVSAQLLSLQLEVVERLTSELLERREVIFPAQGAGWIAGLEEPAFIALPIVRELSRRHRVGAEQIYLNAIEALQQEGLCVITLDAHGRACDLQLPSTTGLDPEGERLVFLHDEDMTADELAAPSDIRARVDEARGRYAAHLVEQGVQALCDLRRRERLDDPEPLLQVVAERANEALELVHDPDEDPRLRTRVTADEVAQAFSTASAAAWA